MRVTQVAIRPTEASESAGRPSLTPELLAASGARYSRNNEGLQSILSRIDPENLDRSVDGIFRMIDYGHQSIADMVPVAMFIDGVSLWLAYYLWTLCPTAGGQESSTRYIKLSSDEILTPEELGIPEGSQEQWRAQMSRCVDQYEESLALWENLASENPDLARIPRSLAEDSSDKAQRQAARMRRNYIYDRARYFLPAAASTNVMLIMSARAWVQVCQHLLSYPLPEAQRLGGTLAEELALAAPRMLRHAAAKPSILRGIGQELETLKGDALRRLPPGLGDEAPADGCEPTPYLDVLLPSAAGSMAADLQFHDNRYAWMGPDLRRTLVRFGWKAMAFAEIRDLNRHRTGTRYCPLEPRGFYCALDQLPSDCGESTRLALQRLGHEGRAFSAAAHSLLAQGEPSYLYWTMLGTQYPFEHSTTADKFIYEAELRTGTGAHFRYARHLHDVLELWYTKFPDTRGLVLEGSAEPE